MAIETRLFDAAEYLDTPEAQAEFLAAAFETGEEGFIKKALATVARAQGTTEIARTDVSRQVLYKSLSEGGDPKLSTLLNILKDLGMQVTIQPAP